MADLADRPNSADRLADIEQDLRACLIAAAQARDTLQSSTIDRLEIEVSTLKDAVSPARDTAETTPADTAPGLRGRLDVMGAASVSILSNAIKEAEVRSQLWVEMPSVASAQAPKQRIATSAAWLRTALT